MAWRSTIAQEWEVQGDAECLDKAKILLMRMLASCSYLHVVLRQQAAKKVDGWTYFLVLIAAFNDLMLSSNRDERLVMKHIDISVDGCSKQQGVTDIDVSEKQDHCSVEPT